MDNKILIIIIVSIVIIIILLIFFLFINNTVYSLEVKPCKYKYELTDKIKRFFNKNSKSAILNKINLFEFNGPLIFYTDKQWSAYNNSFIHDKIDNSFFTIETGKYYYLPFSNA